MDRKQSWKRANKQLESILPKCRIKRPNLGSFATSAVNNGYQIAEHCSNRDDTYLLSEVPIFDAEYRESEICLFSGPEASVQYNSFNHAEPRSSELNLDLLYLIPYLDMKMWKRLEIAVEDEGISGLASIENESPYHVAINKNRATLVNFVNDSTISRLCMYASCNEESVKKLYGISVNEMKQF